MTNDNNNVKCGTTNDQIQLVTACEFGNQQLYLHRVVHRVQLFRSHFMFKWMQKENSTKFIRFELDLNLFEIGMQF